jgi:hypothetical protein
MQVTCDGYSSHLSAAAYDTFREHKIFLVQEDGDTSQTNQPYDQYKAKADKRSIKDLQDMMRVHSKEAFNQYSLIMICIQAFKKAQPKSLIDSFKKVNMHPEFRVSAMDWIKRIDDQIQTGERFFKGRSSLYDAMPQMWRNMDIDMRHQLMTLIDGFYANATATKSPWCPDNIWQLVEFVPLDKVERLRACYLTAKRDPVVITQITEECVENEESVLTTSHWFLEAAKLHPPTLVNALKADCQDHDAQEKLFHHITNHACRKYYGPRGDPGDLEPSQWIDVEITGEQRRLLKPTQKYLLLSSVEKDAYGDGAKKKRARHRQDMIDAHAF